MKANNGKGNNIHRDDWQTPKKFWDELNKQYNFDFDCCASIKNKKVLSFSDDFTNCDFECKDLMCWMNPPFSKADKMFKHFFDVVSKGVAIYRIDNIETKLWNFILKNADWIHIIPYRINYEGHDGKGARFGSALIGIGVESPKIDGVTLQKCI